MASTSASLPPTSARETRSLNCLRGESELYLLNAAGFYHTCAVVNGSVRCWGFNDYGQLGYGNTTNIGDNELPSSAGDITL